jgi:hypothetical protein
MTLGAVKMKLNDINQKIYELQEDIEEFLLELSGENYECRVYIEGDTIRFKLESDLEFAEIVMDEFENFFVEVETPTFKYGEDLLEYLEDLDI